MSRRYLAVQSGHVDMACKATPALHLVGVRTPPARYTILKGTQMRAYS